MHTHTNICTYIQSHIQTYAHACLHAYIHMHLRALHTHASMRRMDTCIESRCMRMIHTCMHAWRPRNWHLLAYVSLGFQMHAYLETKELASSCICELTNPLQFRLILWEKLSRHLQSMRFSSFAWHTCQCWSTCLCAYVYNCPRKKHMEAISHCHFKMRVDIRLETVSETDGNLYVMFQYCFLC
jgi:hypothetical protein